MKEHTLKQLADLGADAAFANNKGHYYMSVSKKSHSWDADEPAREAFAKAVRDAVLANLVTKSDSLLDPKPEPVLVPLDIDDIRATDEFRKTTSAVCVATIWTSEFIWLSGTAALKYSTLATTYERRQHGSSEWKPCTKEAP